MKTKNKLEAEILEIILKNMDELQEREIISAENINEEIMEIALNNQKELRALEERWFADSSREPAN